ncbi:hypothetical protein F4820DRAFT_173325 [Hypoxylon rubiginosum]|uniref:Uncharacterized protein n=1 Tax=Hypoxylon rubiginosum TaxID=110542 RepID=A0ACB9YJI4_9PEZI|nr:hypothetical protein F4820DRAFT_173325 [Hypoxylon rubiginosum]
MSNVVPTASVTFSRPIGNMEAYFPALSDSLGGSADREHWIVFLALKLSFPPSIVDPVPYLKRAWQALQVQHPALGAILSPSGASDLKAQSTVSAISYEPEAWANISFSCRDERDAATLFSSLRPTATATCYWLSKSSEVVLRTSHWRVDGVGMTKLGHRFLATLADVVKLGADAALDTYAAQPPAYPPIGPSLETLIRGSKPPILSASKEDPVLAAAADALVGEFLRGVPSIGLPTRANSYDSLPGSSSRVAITLDETATGKVTATCRERKLKVTSAVHAAIVRATAKFPQHPLSKSYAAFVPVDLRRPLASTVGPETRDDPRVTGLYFSGLPVCIEDVLGTDGKAPKDFETISRELDAVYSRDLLEFWKPEGHTGSAIGFLDLIETYLQRTTALLSATLPEGLPPLQTPDLSSLGKMDAFLQNNYGVGDGAKVKVVDCWLGTETLNRGVQFHTWGWKGKMTLSACFNNSFYEEAFVVDVLGKAIEELLAGCDVHKP